MKNLSKASDEEIYRMGWMLLIVSVLDTKNKTLAKMKREINKEWAKRKVEYIPLSWLL